jgi:hypothetical protein
VAATGAAAAIGTKAAAGLATAAIIAGGAAEINHVATDQHPGSKAAAKHKTVDRGQPVVIPPKAPTDPAQVPPGTQPADAQQAAATQPATAETVTVPPEATDPAATTETGGVTPIPGKHKRKKGAWANSDGQTKTGTQSGPVATGVEPATNCDADGDGAPDPGSTCASGDSVSTGVEQGYTTPVTYSVSKKHKAAQKKRFRHRRAKSG